MAQGELDVPIQPLLITLSLSEVAHNQNSPVAYVLPETAAEKPKTSKIVAVGKT